MKLNIIILKWFSQIVSKSTSSKEKQQQNNASGSENKSQEEINLNEVAGEKELEVGERFIITPTNDVINRVDNYENIPLQTPDEFISAETFIKPEMKTEHQSLGYLNIDQNSPKQRCNKENPHNNTGVIKLHTQDNIETVPASTSANEKENSEVQPNIIKNSWKYLSTVFIKMKSTILPVQKSSQIVDATEPSIDCTETSTGKNDAGLNTKDDLENHLMVRKLPLLENNQTFSNETDLSKQVNSEKPDSSFNPISNAESNLNGSIDEVSLNSSTKPTRKFGISQGLNSKTEVINDSVNGQLESVPRSILKRRSTEENTPYNTERTNINIPPIEEHSETTEIENRRHSSVTFVVPSNVDRESVLGMRYKELSLGATQRSSIINKKKKVTARKHNIGKYL